MKSTFLPSLALVSLVGLSACGGGTDAGGGESGGALRFSAIPDQNSTELAAKYGKIAGYLSEELGIDVEYVPASDYSASVEAFKNGDIQLAWFGGLTGVRARVAVAGAQAIAQGAVDPEFKSYFIANASTGLELSTEFPAALEGKTFTFGSESSTSGRLMPEFFLRENTGKSPQEFFAGEEMNFSGAHDKTALLVQDGTFEAGAMSYVNYERMVADGKIDPEVCVKIWETPTYPDYNWTAHPALTEQFGDDFLDRLGAALVGMKDPELLEAAGRPDGIIAATNEDFAPLEGLARDLGLLR